MNITEYKKYRSEGVCAALAYRRAKSTPRADMNIPEYPNDGDTFEKDGWDLRISVEPDVGMELDHYGEFSDRWKPGAVDHHRRRGTRREYRWFIPAATAEEMRAEFQKYNKMGKHAADVAARKHVLQAYNAILDASVYIVSVHASRKGITLGSASMGGIEDDIDSGIVEELAEEAIHEAEDALENLCASRKK